MTQRRWLKSIIAASQQNHPAMPFQRGARRKPACLKSATPAQPSGSLTAAR